MAGVRATVRGLRERADPVYVTPHDQRLHRLGPLERVDRLDVRHVPDHVVLELDAVPPQEVSRLSDHVARPACVIHLREARDRVAELMLFR